jgi:hypothetical protein
MQVSAKLQRKQRTFGNRVVLFSFTAVLWLPNIAMYVVLENKTNNLQLFTLSVGYAILRNLMVRFSEQRFHTFSVSSDHIITFSPIGNHPSDRVRLFSPRRNFGPLRTVLSKQTVSERCFLRLCHPFGAM